MNTETTKLAVVFSTGILAVTGVFGQGVAFTYQGRLNDNGSPANGVYDLQFAVYDDEKEGRAVGRAITQQSTPVSNGLFTVTLDFRDAPFTGGERWLEIAVSPERALEFRTLRPRQKFTAAPYAITAGNVTGVIPPGGLSGNYPGPVTFGNVSITSGSPGEGKLLMSDASGRANWRSAAELSIFFGQNYSVLLPDVINNITSLEIAGVGTGNVVIVNGPGLQIERIPGFTGTGFNDQPGPSMEHPFVFECDGPLTNALQTWRQQFINDPAANRRSNSVIISRLDGTEVGRWNLFQMGLTAIDPGTDGRHRYTLQHGLPPNNQFGYQRTFNGLGESSRNPATDAYRIEIEGVLQDRYPSTQVDYTNRTITFIFDYAEAGEVYQWANEIAQGIGYKKAGSLITESNGVEVSRRNFFGMFPILFQQTTGFGQVEKLKEKLVVSFDHSEDG